MATRTIGFIGAALLMALSLPAMAQNAGGGGNNGGGRGNFDPAAMRQRMLDSLKTDLGASDDEFKALQPKIESVMQLQRDARGGGGMFGGGRGGRGGNRGGNAAAGGAPAAPAQPQSDVQKALADLQAVLDNKDAKPEDIKAKLDALRDAKTKAKDALAKAQADLKGLLTQRQEAVLVERSMLE